MLQTGSDIINQTLRMHIEQSHDQQTITYVHTLICIWSHDPKQVFWLAEHLYLPGAWWKHQTVLRGYGTGIPIQYIGRFFSMTVFFFQCSFLRKPRPNEQGPRETSSSWELWYGHTQAETLLTLTTTAAGVGLEGMVLRWTPLTRKYIHDCDDFINYTENQVCLITKGV